MAVLQKRRINSPRRKMLVSDQPRIQRIMLDALKEHAETIRAYFEDVVSDWSDANRPTFVVEVRTSRTEIRVEVKPKRGRARKKGKARPDQVFEFVDKGTEPHEIRPKASNKRGLLVFTWGGPDSYQPKTLPIAQAHTGPGAVVGGALFFAKKVHHPGTKARLFSETVQAATYDDFRRKTEAAFRRMERELNRK